MLKILILEDKQEEHEDIENHLLECYDDVKIHPSIDGNWNEIINDIRDNKFESVLEESKTTDVFIIDVSLNLNGHDTLGIDVINYLIKEIGTSVIKKIIITSNGPAKRYPAPLDNIPVVSKMEYRGFHENKIVEILSRDFHFSPRNTSKWDSNKKPNWQFIAYDCLVRFFTKSLIRLLDWGMILVFCYLIVIMARMAVVQLTKVASPEVIKIKEALEISENVFLFILPVMVVFGFFHYYLSTIRIYLLHGATSRVDDDASTKIMKLTKTLFLTSIISFVLIKIIEEIISDKSSLDLEKLLIFGVFLILLLGCSFLLGKKK